MIIVTSYRNPDLDGVACSMAYAELLGKMGKVAKATYYGQLGLEVGFVKDFAKSFPIEKKEGGYDVDDEFVLVDTADPDAVDPEIKPERVLEIFDHHLVVFTEKFVNAEAVIEKVGSCSTLIAEIFKRKNVKLSNYAATYLYAAILSNTINFKNAVTTNRDKQAVEWLKSQLDLPGDFVRQMFVAKSQVDGTNFEEVLRQDFAAKEVNGKMVGIAQIEMVGIDEFVNANKEKLEEFLKRMKGERKLDNILFTGIDIWQAFNRFITIDEQSRELFEQVLKLKDFSGDGKVDYIVMRKEIWPKLQSLFE